MNSNILCPSCHGKKQVPVFGIRYAPGHTGPSSGIFPCHFCEGVGTISTERQARIAIGKAYHDYRVEVLQLGLREAADLWGLKPSHLSSIELGKVETDWKPPGFGVRLYDVTDYDRNYDDWECAFWLAVWAKSSEEAIEYASKLADGERKELLRVSNKIENLWKYAPTETPAKESRREVLRLAGWMYESESQCEHCELYPFGMDEHAVCSECCLCKECRAALHSEPCDMCCEVDDEKQ